MKREIKGRDRRMNTLVWPQKIRICEVGPRDGLQNEKVSLSVEQKIDLIERTVDAGAKSIEIGSFVHPKAVPQMADTDEIARRLKRVDGVEYRTLVLNLKGMERALAAGISKVKLTASASKGHSLANINKLPEDVVRGFAECADFAAKNGMELSGALSVSFGCAFDGKVPWSQVSSVLSCFREIGVSELSLSDATGMGDPRLVYETCMKAQERFPGVIWTLHFHNTRGMGLANVVAGLLAGVTHYDGCFAGLGGCPFIQGAAGNIATEDLVHMCEEMGIDTGFDLDKLIAVGKDVQKLVGHGTDSFVLRAGKNSDLVSLKQQSFK